MGNRYIRLVYPEVMLDSMGNAFKIVQEDGQSMPFALRELLLLLVRQAPVQTAGDAERSLDLLEAIKASHDRLELRLSEFALLEALIQSFAHKRFNPTDGAAIVRYVREHKEIVE